MAEAGTQYFLGNTEVINSFVGNTPVIINPFEKGPLAPLTLEYLVVAGGGGGAGYNSGGNGGGGAGGLLSGSLVVSGSFVYAIVVGDGGAGKITPANAASNGKNSDLHTITSIGGGAGSVLGTGTDGGSGGGCASGSLGGTFPGKGTAGQGMMVVLVLSNFWQHHQLTKLDMVVEAAVEPVKKDKMEI